MSKSKEQLKEEYDVLSSIYDDLPDGAFFAIMEENGFDTDTICWIHDPDE